MRHRRGPAGERHLSSGRAVLVTGASGFVGRQVSAALRAHGHGVTALVRDRARAERLPELSGCRLVTADLLEPEGLRGALDGMDTVLHLVGILRERGRQSFRALVVDGTAALLAEASRAGVARFLYVSAIGADPAAGTGYLRTKGLAEESVRASGLVWLVVRFSILLGAEGEFLGILRRLTRLPVVPLPGHGRFLLQPLLVGDAAEVMARAVGDEAPWGRTHAVCGPRPYELRELLRIVAGGRARLFVPVPWPLVWWGARVLERLLPAPPVTADELAMLAPGSTCDPGPAEAAFGLRFRPVDALLAQAGR